MKMESTTDTVEQVRDAMGVPAETPAADAAAQPADTTVETKAPEGDKPASDDQADKPADGATGDQQATDDASAAGKALAAQKGRLGGRKTSIQTEIDTLVFNRSKAREDSAAEETRLAELRAERAAIEAEIAAKKATPGAPDTTKPAAAAAGGDPEPALTQYEDYQEWIRAHSKWAAREATRELEGRIKADRTTEATAERERAQRTQQEQSHREMFTAHEARMNAFREKTPDFDAVVAAGSDLTTTPVVDAHLVASDMGPALIYHFASNPDDLAAIVKLPPAMQLVRLGKLESRLEAANPGPAQTAPVTKAPAPIKPVGGASTASQVPLGDERESFQDYKRRRQAQIYGDRAS